MSGYFHMLAFPPPDISIRGYFQNHCNKSDLRLQIEYAILLQILFEHTLWRLDKPPFKGTTGKILVTSWAGFLTSGRTEMVAGLERSQFYDGIVLAAERVRRAIPLSITGY